MNRLIILMLMAISFCQPANPQKRDTYFETVECNGEYFFINYGLHKANAHGEVSQEDSFRLMLPERSRKTSANLSAITNYLLHLKAIA